MQLSIKDIIDDKLIKKLAEEDKFLRGDEQMKEPPQSVMQPDTAKLEKLGIKRLEELGKGIFYWSKGGFENGEYVNTYEIHDASYTPSGNGERMKDIPKGYECKLLRTNDVNMGYVYLYKKDGSSPNTYPEPVRL